MGKIGRSSFGFVRGFSGEKSPTLFVQRVAGTVDGYTATQPGFKTARGQPVPLARASRQLRQRHHAREETSHLESVKEVQRVRGVVHEINPIGNRGQTEQCSSSRG